MTCALLLVLATAHAQDDVDPGWARSVGALQLSGRVDTYGAYYSMSGTWWKLAAAASPGFDMHRGFAEFWVKPGLEGRCPLGRQTFTLGTGMLLTAGSGNGYSWGGSASAQRKVWGNSLLARLGLGGWTGSAFVLDPSANREQTSSCTTPAP